MTIPSYNLNQTTEAVLNRAKGRVIKKLATKFSQDVLLQDIDVTEGNANEIAENLIESLKKIVAEVQKIKLFSTISGVGAPGRRRQGAEPEIVTYYLKFSSQNTYDTFISTITSLKNNLVSFQSSFNKIIPSLNYVSNENIEKMNELLEECKKEYTSYFADIKKIKIFVRQSRTVNNQVEDAQPVKDVLTEIKTLIENLNNDIDIQIQNYNDKTTKSNLQRLTPIDALDKEPKLKLKGGRRSYSISHNPLSTVYI